MLDLTFTLNNQPMSALKSGVTSFPAFSGMEQYVNRRVFACFANAGPIPPGEYYIFDRQSGGLLGSFRDLFTGHGNWFALYAADNNIDDDAVFCENIKRGNFRLHPQGSAFGISRGCITLPNTTDFNRLKIMLKNTKQHAIHGSKQMAYGKITVI